MEHTRVSFISGSLEEQSEVLLCHATPDQTLLVTALTPFHPQSHLWPDQPGDSGGVTLNGDTIPVLPCRMGAISPDGTLFVDTDIPVRRGEPDWAFVVVHPLKGQHDIPVGSAVTLKVDSDLRLALSLGHSGCHLAALALNRALLPYWKKIRPSAMHWINPILIAWPSAAPGLSHWVPKSTTASARACAKKG